MRRVIDSAEEYATRGPFTQIFQNPIARVLDQSTIVGNMEQTISMLSESTNLSYKTVEKAVNHLEALGFIEQTRKIGNAQAYKFKVENDLHDFIECARKFQSSRIRIQDSET